METEKHSETESQLSSKFLITFIGIIGSLCIGVSIPAIVYGIKNESNNAHLDKQVQQLLIDVISLNKAVNLLNAQSGLAAGKIDLLQIDFGNGLDSSKLSDGCITNSKILDGSITTTKIQVGAIDDTRISSLSGIKILDNTIGALKIQDNSISTSKLADNSISANKIQMGVIDDTKIISVSGLKIFDNTIGSLKLIDGCVTTTKIMDGSITNGKVQVLAIDDAKISNISSAKLIGSIDGSKLIINSVSDNKIISMSSNKISGSILNTQIDAISFSKVIGYTNGRSVMKQYNGTINVSDSNKLIIAGASYGSVNIGLNATKVLAQFCLDTSTYQNMGQDIIEANLFISTVDGSTTPATISDPSNFRFRFPHMATSFCFSTILMGSQSDIYAVPKFIFTRPELRWYIFGMLMKLE